MSSILRIEGDPTSWTLTAAIDAGQVLMSGAPVAVPVSAPLAGRLLLSPRAVGSVAYLHVLDDHGHIPSGAQLPQPCLYVPSATGPDPHSSPPRYYALPPLSNLAALEAEITAAMSGGTVLTVDLAGPTDNGAVVLNGAALSFVVLCPATPHS
jgi:hypothetical protein